MRNGLSNNTAVCFRKWTRKKFSILVSLHRIVKIGVLCLAYMLVNKPALFAQPQDTSSLNTKEIPEVEVTGQRSQVVASQVTRMVTVIQRDEIEKAGIHNLIDLLEYASNLDVRQRGILGIQADVSIRGSSFDHVMVMINGVTLSDPQTGHFNLDIPIDYESVERIEILEGPSARALGPGAFMGAINIVTRMPSDREISVKQAFGQYGFLRSAIYGGIKSGAFSNYLSISRASSEGYIHNTDFKLLNIYYRAGYMQRGTSVDLQSGFQEKKFGATGFYSPKFPEQYEETTTWFGSLKVTTGNKIKIRPVVYWRHKKDHFMLIRQNPFNENYHLTNTFGSQLNLTGEIGPLMATLGFDLRSEGIFSNRMGYEYAHPRPIRNTDSLYYTRQYNRTNFAGFLEFIIALNRFNITGGAMVNWNSGFSAGAALFPGIDISYGFMDNNQFYISVNRALHLPTFTDMFYSDPFNQGNLYLKPNRLVSWEGGVKLYPGFASFRIAGFYNNGRDIVDWLWSYKTSRFSPVNIRHYSSRGATVNIKTEKIIARPWLSSVSLSYLLLNTSKSVSDSVSKYNNLKNKLSVVLNQQITKNILMSWTISYQDRGGEAMNYSEEAKFYPVTYKPYWLVDWALKWDFNGLDIYTEISNLLNTKYIDAGYAPQPGIWFKGGITFSFGR